MKTLRRRVISARAEHLKRVFAAVCVLDTVRRIAFARRTAAARQNALCAAYPRSTRKVLGLGPLDLDTETYARFEEIVMSCRLAVYDHAEFALRALVKRGILEELPLSGLIKGYRLASGREREVQELYGFCEELFTGSEWGASRTLRVPDGLADAAEPPPARTGTSNRTW